MMNLNHLYQVAMRDLERLGPQHWVLILGGLIVVGVICMRGFGSRSKY
jgi:hypothetical protein